MCGAPSQVELGLADVRDELYSQHHWDEAMAPLKLSWAHTLAVGTSSCSSGSDAETLQLIAAVTASSYPSI